MANNGKALNILAIRFSAIGDVAMTVPVLDSFCRQYPEHHITFLTNPRFEAFFSGMPQNFTFLGADVKKQYHGGAGLRRLIKELSVKRFDLVLDLHGVLRTERIGLGMLLRGVGVRRIRKDRLGRNAVTRQHFKSHTPLRSSFERYCQVFKRAGMPVTIDFKSIYSQAPTGILDIMGAKQGRWVGIAPYAAHQGKIYPLPLMEKVVERLQSDETVSRLFVFAYGKELAPIAHWPEIFDKLTFINGQIPMSMELELMYWLDVMVSMDSSNMHMASLVGTRVVSIWGATHPIAGFLGYGQNISDCVQMDLYCRPCSVYGKKPCRFGDYRCLNGITPGQILQKVLLRE